ncbi:MAG: sigma-54 dependent transcriptional regulator [Clostridiales Family XIII bacterium]|nr:sigma-54 dependent transcriptional regulator [Clostridiales Family XIII bacterium]
MIERYGMKRVLEPRHVLSTSAWRVDNRREIYANEVRVSLIKLHIETTSFRQICIESNNNVEKIKARIIDIVSERGKLHNPVTDTGGVLYGRVEEIGAAYDNPAGVAVGDRIICNASLAAIPILINRVRRVDMSRSQIEAEGYGILFSEFPVLKKPGNISTDLLLFACNESGTLYQVSRNAAGKKNFLVLGNHMVSNILFGYAIRKAAGIYANITCFFDKSTDSILSGAGADQLLEKIFTEVRRADILKPVECVERHGLSDRFDLTVNCADLPGAETVSILATKPKGTVFFANLINNYNIALYITEAISRQIEIRCADGYVKEYGDFDIEMVRELEPYFANAKIKESKVTDDIDYPLSRAQKSLEQAGYRKSLAGDFICESRAMAAVLSAILSVAKYDCNVMIIGDTGVGKEKAASIIQKNSGRRTQPYIRVNCAAISPNLLESEFFGYEKGAFTGAASAGKKGYFEMANNGILFLDEVAELPFDLQAKLLRVIQDGEFFRVGGTTPVKINVRVLSATNRDLEKLAAQNLFRRDLYYRLNVFPIRVPSLAERRTEIPALAEYFLKRYSKKFGLDRSISDDALDYLKERDWPGNIRELENMIQRLMITAAGERITLIDVMKELHTGMFAPSAPLPEQDEGDGERSLSEMVENLEKKVIEEACRKYGSSRKAARAIGVSQSQLIRKKNKYGIGAAEE